VALAAAAGRTYEETGDDICSKLDEDDRISGTLQLAGQCTRSAHSEGAMPSAANKFNYLPIQVHVIKTLTGVGIILPTNEVENLTSH
jgi:hypothetical protein